MKKLKSEIKIFLEKVFSLEKDVLYLEYFKEKIEKYNAEVKKLNEYCHNSFDKELGQVVEFNIQGALQNPRSDFYYETIKKNDAPIHRDIFKISEYSNKKYGQMWACYVSTSDPGLGKSKLIDTCFLVSNIDKDLKFIAKYNPDYDTNLWSYRGGDKELEDFYKLGRLIKVTRYLSPVNDEWSIKEYNKDA